jgi:FtsP/CotA-like multicopper oxidase with cupredoxin domain
MSKRIVAYALAFSAILALLSTSLIVKVSYAQTTNPPHYYGPYPNYATSQLPTVTTTTPPATFTLTGFTVQNGGSSYTTPTVIITGGGGTGATATARVTNGVITALVLTNPGTGYTSAPTVTISDPHPRATGAAVTPTFITTGGTPIVTATGGIRKFIDTLPGLGPSAANNLGQYIPVAVSDTVTYPGCDYYEIGLVQYTEKMHTDLMPSTLRGYVQLSTTVVPGAQIPLTYPNGTAIMINGVQAKAVDNPHYLGPTVVAQRDKPVRVKFVNLLPTGSGGDLFLPTDTTIMGAGDGPHQIGVDAQGNPIYEQYKQNRASVHLHGGNTPWISDGTAHQWITPAGESTSYPKGVSVQYVPDMWFVNGAVVPHTVGQTTAPVAGATNNPGAGAMTFYYTNEQSARLMFYHDHAVGITRLNVYAGEAAGYVLTDPVEQGLITQGILPNIGIPLVIQDKTFVPDNTVPITNMFGTFPSQLAFQDPTWDVAKWGGPGSLWYPHVYMEMQNPGDPSGFIPFGRWQYSPWWWPPFTPTHGPIANPYYVGGPLYNPAYPYNSMEYPLIPGTPNPSIPGEAFMDTPMVNGAVYPYMTVQPTTYRFRVLNAADDRFWNLQWYVADNTVVTSDGRINTEVKMVPAVENDSYPATWPADLRTGGVPDPNTRGPAWIQIGTEGGFLPAPVLVPNQPVDWNQDQGTFDFGVVNTHSLLLGTAERADVIVDFSNFAGKTLILYNDAPAAFPTADPRLDYFTDDIDQTDTGGAPSTVAGFGPNTRTIMQVRVSGSGGSAPQDDYNPATLAALEAAFASTATTQGVFARDQNTIIVPQAAYNSAYHTTFPDIWANIFDNSLTFTPVGSTTPVTIPFQAKSMHDEMGGTFDADYGRMSGSLGVEIPKSTPQTATTILYGFDAPPTEIIASTIYGTPIGTLGDGTQIWKITHNGVDTHTMHWHMFEVQLINRVAWDNNVRWPDLTEIGWKDTLRVNPLQDTIIALRPITHASLPFDIPNNIRPINPAMPLGAVLATAADGFLDPTGQPTDLTNHLVNYGSEFVWHCHILAHEENDMMRSTAAGIAPKAPVNLIAVRQGSTASLTWTDNSLSETNFTIQRTTNLTGTWTTIATLASTTGPIKGVTVSYGDSTIASGTSYWYRVQANDVIGDTWVYAAPAVGFPTLRIDSAYSNTAPLV